LINNALYFYLITHPKTCQYSNVKGIVHTKMKILSPLTHPQVVPNLYTFISPAEHKTRFL